MGGWIAPRTVQLLAPAPGTPAVVGPGALYPPVRFCHPRASGEFRKGAVCPWRVALCSVFGSEINGDGPKRALPEAQNRHRRCWVWLSAPRPQPVAREAPPESPWGAKSTTGPP